MNERETFSAAIEIADPKERSDWLDKTCGNDRAFRQRLELLLANHDPHANFLERPPVELEKIATLVNAVDTKESAFTVRGSRGTSAFPAEELDLGFLDPADHANCLGRLGDYDVLQVIGRGGMGLVLQGVDSKLERNVALKVSCA